MRKHGFWATNAVLLLLCLMYAIIYIDRTNISTAAIAFRSDFKLSNIEYGWVFSAFAYTYAVFQILGGFIGDRFGPRITLTIFGLVWAVATLSMGLVEGFWSLVLVRLALGAGEGATLPTATRVMGVWVKPGSRGFAQGVTHSFARLGNALTPPLFALLIAAWGWRGSFLVSGLASFLWVAVWFWYFRDNPRDHSGVSEAELAVLPTVIKNDSNPVPWARLIRRMMPTTVVYFCYGWTLWVYVSWLPQFLQQGYKLDLKNSALFAGSIFFAGVVGDALGGVITDTILKRTKSLVWARSRTICVSFVLSLLCLIPIFAINSLLVLTLALAGAFFFLELAIGPAWALPIDIAPKHAGTAAGIMNTGAAIAAIISPTAFGYTVELSGSWTAPFFASIALLLFGALATFWIDPDRSLENVRRSSEGREIPAPEAAVSSSA